MGDNENDDIRENKERKKENKDAKTKTANYEIVGAVTIKSNDDCEIKDKDKKTGCNEAVNAKDENFEIVSKENRKVTSRSANALFLLLRTVMCLSVVMKQWMVLLVMVSVVGALKEQKFAIEPQDQSAVVGSRVTLPCRVESKAGQLQWTKDDFGLGTHRHLVGYERYKMIGSDEEGDYSLDIENVTLDDDTLYQCQVSSGPKGEPAIRSRYARLLVLVPPDPPKILQGPILQTVEDREVNLECVSVGGKPAAEITWVDDEGGVLTQGVTYTAEPMTDGRRFTARSVLHLRPRRHHHNQSFSCQAQNTADRAYRSTSIKLLVLFAPKVKIFIKSGLHKGVVKEGDSLVLGCQASGNPNNLTYKWYVNGERVVTTKPDLLVLTNVTRKYNQATIKCEVHNTVGKSADTKTVDVTYGPTFTMRPQDVETDLGSTVTLTCGVDGHPEPRILWLRYENERIIRVGKSTNLTISVTSQSSGQYWCRASVDNYSDIEASAMVYVRGPPKIISNDTQYGIEGDSVRIDCVSFSVPKPDYVMWTFGGAEINSFHNNEYSFLEESLPDGIIRSSLIIRESQSSHFGAYNCTVSNSYGTDSLEITLIAEKSFPLIVVATGLSSAAVMLVMIMLIIMLCHRKTSSEKKSDLTDVKTCYKESDRSSNISDLKLELRQVEGSCDETLNAGSETELHSTLHLTTNLGLPLAGPVPLPDAGYDNELMKQYQRYSGDFNQAINFNFKTGQTNGYVPYVDYSRDYAPPSGDSLNGSLSRSIHSAYPSQGGSLQRQASCGTLGLVGPDVIPMVNPGVMLNGGMDVRYAATYGNPYLRGSGPLSIGSQGSSSKPPPPYYSIKNSNLQIPATSLTSPTSSSSSSRPMTSPVASSCSTNSGAQPQVPKSSPQKGALYVLPPSSQGSLHTNKVTTKGNGASIKAGTHV